MRIKAKGKNSHPIFLLLKKSYHSDDLYIEKENNYKDLKLQANLSYSCLKPMTISKEI